VADYFHTALNCFTETVSIAKSNLFLSVFVEQSLSVSTEKLLRFSRVCDRVSVSTVIRESRSHINVML